MKSNDDFKKHLKENSSSFNKEEINNIISSFNVEDN
jgi:hypothetical protein